MFNTSSSQKKNLQQLKNIIDENCKYLQKRGKLINYQIIKKAFRYNFNDDISCTIHGKRYSISELQKEFKKRYQSVNHYMKRNSYTSTLRKSIKDTRKDKETNYQNITKELEKLFSNTKNDLDFCLQTIKEITLIIKNQNKKKEVTTMENMTVEERRRKLYEMCAAGEITLEEREDLLLNINNESFFESLTEKLNDFPEGVTAEDIIFGESEDAIKYMEEMENEKEEASLLTPTEKFRKVRSALYEKCANGEFSVEKREELLKEAYEHFFTTSNNEKEGD